MKKVREKSEKGWAWLNGIPPKHLTQHAVPRPNYGHMTSPLCESLIATLVKARTKSPLECVKDMIQRESKSFAEKNEQASEHKDPLCIKPQACLLWNLELAKNNTIQQRGERGGYVKNTENGRVNVVCLDKKEYTRSRFQQHRIPCSHACALIQYLKLLVVASCDVRYTVTCFEATYTGLMPPLVLKESLSESKEKCEGPTESRRKHRPRGKKAKSKRDHWQGEGPSH